MRQKSKSNGKPTGNRRPQQLRALRTRKELIKAARHVFARDGFELARLEDISAAAGKTRGAFYDNFKNKEDVFFAILEEDLTYYWRRVSKQFTNARSRSDRIEAFSRHLLDILKDRRRMMLFLEFKIYAIRHSGRTKRLANIQSQMCLGGVEFSLEPLIPELQNRTRELRRTNNAQFGAIVDGLFVNRMFNPASLNDKQIMQFIRAAVHEILSPRS